MSDNNSLVKKLAELEAQLLKLPVVAEILTKLENCLSKNLCYHTVEHTRDVIHEVLLFSLYDKLPEKECTLLAIGAAYHDAGFLEQPKENERIGAKMAAAAMEQNGYSKEDIDAVFTMIEDTQLRPVRRGFAQVPSCPLSRYLLDADLSNLGRDDFFTKAEIVRKEIGAPDTVKSMKKVLILLRAHQWHTPAAQALRQAQKDANLIKLRKQIAAMRAAGK